MGWGAALRAARCLLSSMRREQTAWAAGCRGLPRLACEVLHLPEATVAALKVCVWGGGRAGGGACVCVCVCVCVCALQPGDCRPALC